MGCKFVGIPQVAFTYSILRFENMLLGIFERLSSTDSESAAFDRSLERVVRKQVLNSSSYSCSQSLLGGT
jgi:hypothetical protein